MGSKCNTKTGGVPVPVGFGFYPTEEELVEHYLKKKKHDKNFKDSHVIAVIDICKHDPWDLPALLSTEPESPSHDTEWFCFSPRDYKYIKSTRFNRMTPKGFWKITGQERDIKARRSKAVIGRKRTLTFHLGRVANHTKTNWVMHEYYLIESDAMSDSKLAQRDFVLCRLKKNPDKKDASICPGGEPSSSNLSNCEDQVAAVLTPESHDYSSSALQSPAYMELGDVLQANGTNDDCYELQSPFGDNTYSLMNKNDILTCDEGEPHNFTVSDFEIEVPDDMFWEPGKNLDPQQSPTYTKLEDIIHINVFNDDRQNWQSQFGDNVSYGTYKNNISTYDDNEFVSYTACDFENQPAHNMILEPCGQQQEYRPSTLQAPIYTKLGSVPLADVYNNECQSMFWDNYSYFTKDKNNISTIDDDDQVSKTVPNFENQATDKSISEVCPQPEENLELFCRLPEIWDYTLQPQMNSEVGDVLLDNNYNGCNEFHSPMWSY